MRMRFPLEESLALPAVVCLLALMPVGAQQNSGAQQNAGTTPTTSGRGTGTRVEKFKVKQEFGPQTVSRRGDRTAVATPPGQGDGTQGTNSGNSANGSSDAIKQDFGPTAHGLRKETTSAPNAIDAGGKPLRLQTTKNSIDQGGKPQKSTDPK